MWKIRYWHIIEIYFPCCIPLPQTQVTALQFIGRNKNKGVLRPLRATKSKVVINGIQPADNDTVAAVFVFAPKGNR
jgi:hypothetical protein